MGYFPLLKEVNQKVLERANGHILQKKTSKVFAQHFFQREEESEEVFSEALAQRIQNICKELPLDHDFSDTDLLVIKVGYTGLVPLNGIKEQDLQYIENLYQNIKSGHTQIKIEGSQLFQDEILYDIRILLSRQIAEI